MPAGGTSLYNAFEALRALPTPPDNIFLLTDGLPTQAERPPRGSKVSGNQRLKFFRDAIRRLPEQCAGQHRIYLPMEGDPMAASEYWQLAQRLQRQLFCRPPSTGPEASSCDNDAPPPEFSLSFLDVICCGFGAVILLLMITKTVQPQVIEKATVDAEAAIAKLTEQLFEIRGETTILNRDLTVKREQISDYDEQIAILQGTLARTRSNYDALNLSQNANAIIREQLAIARQKLSEEELRLLGRNAQKKEPIDWWHSRRQRVHYFHYRHLGIHVLLCVGTHAARDGGHAQHLPRGQGYTSTQRYG